MFALIFFSAGQRHSILQSNLMVDVDLQKGRLKGGVE